jgi:DNA mismatch repair ATPase MutL
VVLCLTATKRQRATIQRPKDKEQQYSDQKIKNNNIATKRQRTTIQRPKNKEQKKNNQKKKNNKKTNKKQKTTKQKQKKKKKQNKKGFWSLYCSLSFGRCIVVLFLLVAVFLLFVFWSLYCCSLSFIRFIVFFCLLVEQRTIQRPKAKEQQYNGQKTKNHNITTKR